MSESTEPDCACGKSIDEVSLAHYPSCGPGASMSPDEAADLQDRVVAGLDRAIGPLAAEVLGVGKVPPVEDKGDNHEAG